MRFRDFLKEGTVNSVSADQIGKTIKNWFYKNSMTRADYDRDIDHNLMDFDEWREFTFDRYIKMQVHPISIKLHLGDMRWLVEPKTISPYLNRYSDRDEWREESVKWLEKLVRPLGWYVANARSHIILLPLKQEVVKVPRFLYHFSPVFNKERILRKGIIPKGTATSHGERFDYAFRYPPRIHLYTEYDLDKIRELAYHIFNHDADIESFYHGTNMIHMPLAVFEIDTSKCKPGTKFYEDHGVPNGVWTYTHIPASAITVKFEDHEEEDLQENDSFLKSSRAFNRRIDFLSPKDRRAILRVEKRIWRFIMNNGAFLKVNASEDSNDYNADFPRTITFKQYIDHHHHPSGAYWYISFYMPRTIKGVIDRKFMRNLVNDEVDDELAAELDNFDPFKNLTPNQKKIQRVREKCFRQILALRDILMHEKDDIVLFEISFYNSDDEDYVSIRPEELKSLDQVSTNANEIAFSFKLKSSA